VLELVLQHLADRGPQGTVLVLSPHREVLAHPEDLDRLQDQVDGGGAEDAGHRDHQPELEPAAPVETRQIEAEELLQKAWCRVSMGISWSRMAR
jgi:hypothetical protein